MMIELDEYTKLHMVYSQFHIRMHSKLMKKMESKSGWDDPNWNIEDIKRQLIEHIEKGDFVDVANFAMFADYNLRGKDEKRD